MHEYPIESPRTAATPTAEPSSTSSMTGLYYFCSAAFIIGALVFAGMGLHTLYDDSYGARVVGGDAYNFIIYSTRGTALICAGIVCAVLSVTFAIFAHAARGLARGAGDRGIATNQLLPPVPRA
jgi:hypothetical protein